MRMFIFSVCVGLLLSGCIPTIIGAAVYKSSKTKQAKQAFMEDFNKTNIEREKAGLQPLDLCTEKYGFDKKWADDDPVCAERIAKYEAGDTTALGPPQMVTQEEAAAEIKEGQEKEVSTPP